MLDLLKYLGILLVCYFIFDYFIVMGNIDKLFSLFY